MGKITRYKLTGSDRDKTLRDKNDRNVQNVEIKQRQKL